MALFGSGPVHLDSPETMFAVLRELVGGDAATWRGMIDVWDQNGSTVWRIEVNDDKGHSVSAVQGDYLVLTYGRLLKLDPSEV